MNDIWHLAKQLVVGKKVKVIGNKKIKNGSKGEIVSCSPNKFNVLLEDGKIVSVTSIHLFVIDPKKYFLDLVKERKLDLRCSCCHSVCPSIDDLCFFLTHVMCKKCFKEILKNQKRVYYDENFGLFELDFYIYYRLDYNSLYLREPKSIEEKAVFLALIDSVFEDKIAFLAYADILEEDNEKSKNDVETIATIRRFFDQKIKYKKEDFKFVDLPKENYKNLRHIPHYKPMELIGWNKRDFPYLRIFVYVTHKIMIDYYSEDCKDQYRWEQTLPNSLKNAVKAAIDLNYKQLIHVRYNRF